MTVGLTLTDEQAQFLAKTLGELVKNDAWARPESAMPLDDREHAETIKRKLDERLKGREW